MPENPLLPNAELRALHTLLKRAAKLKPQGREALLAATLQQLQPGDLVLTPGPLPATLLPKAVAAPQLPPNLPFLPLAAAAAAALPTTTQPRPLALAVLASNQNSPNWPEALTWAQTQRLPLILAIADPSGANALRPQKVIPNPKTPTWTSLSKLAQKLKIPILTVDGEDAVAVYRVMAESILRARSGDGPAILWAVLPTARELAAGRPPSATPLRRLQRFLRVRKITL